MVCCRCMVIGRASLVVGLLAVLLIVVFMQAPAPQAATGDSIDTLRFELIAQKAEDLQSSRAKFENTAVEELAEADIQKYLADALWAVYLGLVCNQHENGEHPSDPVVLAGTKYIPVWPGNPYNNWEPMQVLDLEDGFSAGDLTLQFCPPEFYSGLRNLKPLSLELSIFGPLPEYASFGDAEPLEENTWAKVPEGALYMCGMYVETSAQTWEKYNKLQAALKEQEQQEAEEK